MISESVSQHIILEEIIKLGGDISEISADIEIKNKAIQTQNVIISDCDEQIKTLEQYLKDNFEVCDICGSVK